MYWTAFVLGFLGNFHCLGMCGPLALAIPLKNKTLFGRFLSVLVYNLGRIVTYAFLGAALGLVGSGVAWSGHQQGLSVILGILMISSTFISVNPFKNKQFKGRLFKFINRVKTLFAKLFQTSSYGSLFLIGILNGLIPCGLVYTALAGAVLSDAMWEGALYMVFFGVGTIPVMMVVPYFKYFLSPKYAQRMNWITPVVAVLFGVLLILRGVNLGIPFVSPKIDKNCNQIHCCH